MMKPEIFQSCLRKTAFFSLPVGLMLLSLPMPQAQAGNWNQFDVCVGQLKDSGVASDKAGTACSGALIPKELSECVVIVRRNSPIDADNALQGCYQVRRPIDLGNCVADIQRSTLGGYTGDKTTTGTVMDSPSLAALNSCRKSLLPGRHSECVIALSRDTATYTPIKAMDTCLAAEDFPKDLFPAYVQQPVQ
ncbi:MAG: hypothetical protein VKL41_06245 [Snowella sp.]|nr:hypothetical protein [Snowella sp.]